ncbi:uncharacterized protein LOC113239747 [Hyposmocoma kahamanoa]|uniref:uncharacterized protein LOC113236231 n=1 Tax=Hyposmocoma kahamanoa TaxID=1477025 RepID=UPI000E6D64DE|nr:uncharacterized protein LOC113236231 [Hyposmocoma kahamanoa]XP_026332632.1 uncharacterized protein LOC113239747 [Hyposmocoma kahamanoa]
MVVKCSACCKFMSTVEGANVACPICKKQYHKECVGVRKNDTVPSSWACPDCKSRLPRSNQDNTPIKTHDVRNSSPKAKNPDSKRLCETGGDSEETSLAYELRAFRLEMSQTREELKGLRQDLFELRSTVRSCENRLDRVEETVQIMMTERASGGGTDSCFVKVIQALEANVERLQHDLNDRDQVLLLNEVELSGVPEENGENPIHIALACAAKLGMQLDEREVVSCARTGAPRREVGARPRPLALRLTRRDTRDVLLRGARVRRHLTTEDLGLKSEPRPFYINERLTSINRRLFYLVRQTAGRLQWKYVWTRDGRIYVRREAGAPAHRIRCESDLVKIFGPDGVCPPPPETGLQ